MAPQIISSKTVLPWTCCSGRLMRERCPLRRCRKPNVMNQDHQVLLFCIHCASRSSSSSRQFCRIIPISYCSFVALSRARRRPSFPFTACRQNRALILSVCPSPTTARVVCNFHFLTSRRSSEVSPWYAALEKLFGVRGSLAPDHGATASARASGRVENV